MKNIAVVVPSRTASNLVTCVDAIRKHETEGSIYVVDDGLEWKDQIEVDRFRFYPRTVQFVNGAKPFVFSRNCNIGIRAAGPRDGYVLLNDDALLESPGGFQLLAEACEADPSIGIIGAVTNLTGQRLQWRRKPIPELPDLSPVRIVPHIAFVCVYIPERTIMALRMATAAGNLEFSSGLLDERYVGYGCDDADYCEQVARAGLKVAVHDGCYVNHGGSGTLQSTYRGEAHAPGDYSDNFKLLMAKWGHLVTQPDVRGPR